MLMKIKGMSAPIVIAPAPEGQLQDYSVDQVAGAFVLVLGAIASLLLVIWQSKCHCKMNLCYIFQCERRPPSEEEMKGLQHQIDKREKDKKQDKILDKEDKILEEEIKIEKKLDIVFDEESAEEEDLTPPKKLKDDNP
tara:strand:- start:4456 stop:4869 length:414 start_codon:yes stop_codon:yes gene_type:complete